MHLRLAGHSPFNFVISVLLQWIIISPFIFFYLVCFIKKDTFYLFSAALGIIAASSLLRSELAVFMNAHFFMQGKQQPAFSEIFLNSFINIFIWVLALVTAKLIWDKIQNQQYIQSIEKEKAINELNFLKAQINPHFLFNSLNSIYGYIDKKNKTARNILLQFSEMLRYQLYDCNADRVSISKEIAYLRNYVLLQQYRKEENLIVQFNTDDPLEEFEIAPLLLVVFIENAFKYVSNFEEKENKIIISLQHKNDNLNFSVFNTTENRHGSVNGGIGLTNVKRRLEILYPNKHDLIIHKEKEYFNVCLQIDLT